MRIIVDMDEVLVQFVDEVLCRWNTLKDTRFTRDHIDMWHMEATLGPGSFEKITEWIAEPDFFENLEPMPGAIHGFNTLRQDHDVVIATSLAAGIENGYDSKRRWLKKHFPDFDHKHFICTSRKGLLKGDVLIDDAVHFLEDWWNNGNNRAITFHAPWNRVEKNFPRAAKWEDVLSIINFWEAHDEFDKIQRQMETAKTVELVEKTLDHVDKLMKPRRFIPVAL